jgi:hypothetical protein
MAVALSGRRAGAAGLRAMALVAGAVALAGLAAWELRQRTIDGMVFDRADLVASFGGCFVALPLLWWSSRWTWR